MIKTTEMLPKQFSFINIKDHSKKSSRKDNATEKPLKRRYKFFYENYIFDVQGKSSTSHKQEYQAHVKCKCYRSQKKNETPHTVTVTLSSNGDVSYVKYFR
jgi:hypothetical protein